MWVLCDTGLYPRFRPGRAGIVAAGQPSCTTVPSTQAAVRSDPPPAGGARLAPPAASPPCGEEGSDSRPRRGHAPPAAGEESYPVADWDALSGSLSPIWLQFRAEMFNAFNHPNFGLPGTTFGAPTFGIINPARTDRAVRAQVLLLGARGTGMATAWQSRTRTGSCGALVPIHPPPCAIARVQGIEPRAGLRPVRMAPGIERKAARKLESTRSSAEGLRVQYLLERCPCTDCPAAATSARLALPRGMSAQAPCPMIAA